MHRLFRTTALALMLPAGALAADLNQYADLIRKCAHGRCENAVGGLLAELGREDLSDAEKVEELGLIALAVYDAARVTEDPETRMRSSRSLRLLAEATDDSAQKDAFVFVADAIETGDTSLYDLDDPFSVSPY